MSKTSKPSNFLRKFFTRKKARLHKLKPKLVEVSPQNIKVVNKYYMNIANSKFD